MQNLVRVAVYEGGRKCNLKEKREHVMEDLRYRAGIPPSIRERRAVIEPFEPLVDLLLDLQLPKYTDMGL
jgi:hypothetical protein